MKNFLYVVCLLLLLTGLGFAFNQSGLVLEDVTTYGQRGWRWDEAIIRALIGVGGLMLAWSAGWAAREKKTTFWVVGIFFVLYTCVQVKLIIETLIHAGESSSAHYAVFLKRDAREMAVTLGINATVIVLLWFSLRKPKTKTAEQLDYVDEKMKVIIIDKFGNESVVTGWKLEDVK